MQRLNLKKLVPLSTQMAEFSQNLKTSKNLGGQQLDMFEIEPVSKNESWKEAMEIYLSELESDELKELILTATQKGEQESYSDVQLSVAHRRKNAVARIVHVRESEYHDCEWRPRRAWGHYLRILPVDSPNVHLEHALVSPKNALYRDWLNVASDMQVAFLKTLAEAATTRPIDSPRTAKKHG